MQTYLALGDSYTIGESVTPDQNFPHQLVALLKKEGQLFEAPRIIAKTGWTTDELDEAIQKTNVTSRYDWVSLLIGVNNQYRGRHVDDYALQFESLLKQAIHFAGDDPSHVIVVSIPDWGATPFAEGRDRMAIASEIDIYNGVNEKISGRYHVHYINITPGSRMAIKDSSLVTSDGLHPSGKEYARWTALIKNTMLPLLEQAK